MEIGSALIQRYGVFPPAGQALVVNIEDARLIRDLSQSLGSLQVYHRSAGTLDRLARQLAALKNVHIHRESFPLEEGVFDVAVVELPKGREAARLTLLRAVIALKPGAFVFAVGANAGGAKMMQDDIAEAAPTRILGNKARWRIFSVRRPDSLSLPAEWGLPWEMQLRQFEVRDQVYTLHTLPGVFSWDHLDAGSAFLLEHLSALPEDGRFLDAGCGYGILGLVAQREFAPAAVIWADDDLWAVACARQNAPPDQVLAADLLAAPLPQTFDVILCNPPFHKEQDKDLGFMQGFSRIAPQMLAPNGRLVIVANSFLPYRSLLEAQFSRVQTVADDGRFQVLAAFKGG